MLAAGADDVSAAVADLFGSYGQTYQTVSAQMASLQKQFVQGLVTGGISYASAEAAATAPLQAAAQSVLDVINAPTQALLGRPLIGNGGAGGLIFGSGGANGLA